MSLALPYLACMLAAGPLVHPYERALPSIQVIEGGAPGVIHHNTDGSSDLGVMQVNTRWVRPIAAANNMPEDAVSARLRDDACFNIRAAAAILSIYLRETHDDLLEAVGDYHSHTKPLNQAYQAMVIAAAARLAGSGAFLTAPITPPHPQVRFVRPVTPSCIRPRVNSVSSLTEPADPALHCR